MDQQSMWNAFVQGFMHLSRVSAHICQGREAPKHRVASSLTGRDDETLGAVIEVLVPQAGGPHVQRHRGRLPTQVALVVKCDHPSLGRLDGAELADEVREPLL